MYKHLILTHRIDCQNLNSWSMSVLHADILKQARVYKDSCRQCELLCECGAPTNSLWKAWLFDESISTHVRSQHTHYVASGRVSLTLLFVSTHTDWVAPNGKMPYHPRYPVPANICLMFLILIKSNVCITSHTCIAWFKHSLLSICLLQDLCHCCLWATNLY